jgi:NADH:ubiquinone oxidoreductase subunit D
LAVFKTTHVVEVDPERAEVDNPFERYEDKIDEMRQEMKLMRQSLNSILEKRSVAPRTFDVASSLQHASDGTPFDETSPAGLSTIREDNTQMAMTRENSLEPVQPSANAAMTVEEPMGSLYEVTRLRNIRSNRARTARPASGHHGELNDFISRGVISEPEAEELYRM